MNFNEIAFYFSNTQATWHGIIIGIALLGSVLMAVILRFVQKEKISGLLFTIALSCIISPLLGRFVYYYCCSGQFDSFFSAMTVFSGGGFSLIGVVAGMFISAFLARIFKVTDNLPKLLDCILPAGVLGIAVARLAGFFSTADKGKFIITDTAYQKLPFAFPMEDSAGETEWRIPTFLYESIASFIIFAVLLIIFFRIYSKKMDNPNHYGITALLSMSFFGAVQACLESMRYDTLFMRSNGFVSMVQIFFIVIALIPFFILLVRGIKLKGFNIKYVFAILGVLIFTGAAAYCEYLVQRYADQFVVLYFAMMGCLIAVCLIVAMMAAGLLKKSKKKHVK